MDGALIDRDGRATFETSEVMLVLVGGTVERFAASEGSDVNEALPLQTVEGTVNSC